MTTTVQELRNLGVDFSGATVIVQGGLFLSNSYSSNSNNRNMLGNNFAGANLTGANLQSDGNEQHISVLTDEIKDHFTKLFAEIETKVTDPEEKAEVIAEAKTIQSAANDNNWTKAKRFIGKLPNIIRTTASAISIEEFIDSMIP